MLVYYTYMWLYRIVLLYFIHNTKKIAERRVARGIPDISLCAYVHAAVDFGFGSLTSTK